MASESIAFCGLYCGACSFKVAFEENDREHLRHMPACYERYKDEPLEPCPGCRLEKGCGECGIRDCAMDRGFAYCSQCDDFPCGRLVKFNDDGKPHHGEAVSNLRLLKEIGEEKWLVLMRERWTCQCGARYSWYHRECRRCDAGEFLTPLAPHTWQGPRR